MNIYLQSIPFWSKFTIMEKYMFNFLLRCIGISLSPTMIFYTIHHIIHNNYANAALGIVMFVFALWLALHEE